MWKHGRQTQKKGKTAANSTKLAEIPVVYMNIKFHLHRPKD